MSRRALALLWLLGAACATRAPRSRPAPPADAEYGTPHPFQLQAAAPDGRWFIACQAREDTNHDGRIEVVYDLHGGYGSPAEGGPSDTMRPYLFLEPGAGVRIDEALAWDEAGRYLVLTRDGTLRLLDTRSGDEQVLSTGPFTASPSPFPTKRASFSRDGTRLLYLRPEGGRTVAVLRDVTRGVEHVVDAGAGLLGQASLDAEGRWMTFDVVAEDTDEDGMLTWPEPRTTLAPSLCRGMVAVSSHAGWRGDRPVRRMRHVAGGPLLEGDEFLQPVGDRMLRRLSDGAIVAEDARGRREAWVPASCAGQVLDVDAPRSQVLVACEASGAGPLPLEVYGHGTRRSLDWSVPDLRTGRESIRGQGRLRMVWAHPSGSNAKVSPIVVDLERRAVVPTPVPGGESQMAEGDHVLLIEDTHRRDLEKHRDLQRVWLWNVATGARHEVGMTGLDTMEQVGDLALFMGWLIDMRQGQVLGQVEQDVLTHDTRGRALRPTQPTSPQARRNTVPPGPVRWGPTVTPVASDTR
ncbi:hypothetical protein LZ198_10200 [Myxococcus sp. K15C18031901]|uniref:hypothetical protein n=1 Tax=Myxococcus dinghuensis TaxID=2906761 RepID=UPI0020A80A33|nr:hypothetical protein [Myxococcus dinghuensis]MCP3099241.1 hypothetical protein [Myxococcus dinghuensis]